MAKELETSFSEDIPTLTSWADADEILMLDDSATTGSKIKGGTALTLYNYVKAKIDAAYGAFVTRWPTWTEVTAKPAILEGAGRVLEPAAAGTVTLELGVNEANHYDIQMPAGNITINHGTIPAALVGKFYITIRQDGTGSRTITWSGGAWLGDVSLYGAGLSTLQPGSSSNEITVFEFFTDGTNVTLLNRVNRVG